MASDSRVTYSHVNEIEPGVNRNSFTGHYFDTTDKTFLLKNNCGISTCGNATIEGKPLTGFIKAFSRDFVEKEDSVLLTAEKLNDYFKNIPNCGDITFHIFGIDKTRGIDSKIQGYRINTISSSGITNITDKFSAGASWDGQVDILNRIIKESLRVGVYYNLPAGTEIKIPKSENEEIQEIVTNENSLQLFNDDYIINSELSIPWVHMSIQDAIDFAEFAIKTTIDTMKFTTVNKTVGGPIDILVITPEEAKWIKKKPSY